jgi:outer membrane receptor protein involved in Fe transport
MWACVLNVDLFPRRRYQPSKPPFAVRLPSFPLCLLLIALCALLPQAARAEVIEFNLPAQPLAGGLLAFSKQAKAEVLFSLDKHVRVQANAVTGGFEPEDALAQLLRGTGFTAHRNNRGKFVITVLTPAPGVVRGRLLLPDGSALPGIGVRLAGTEQSARTDEHGDFTFPEVPAGVWRLFVVAEGFRPMEFSGVTVEPHRTLTLAPQRLRLADEVTVLEPYVVRAESNSLRTAREADLVARRAAGNLDLPRTNDDALPYAIYTREQIARSGVVNLNQFLQRELLDSDAAASPPEQDPAETLFATGSRNLKLRGFELDETVIFVNGRRLPETLKPDTGVLGAPDVNFIPLGLIQQVEVLPVSASALYGGNAVGGVINIVLRPDLETTEVTTSYTNTLGGYDASESSVSLLHGRSLLDGRLRLRLNLTSTRSMPPVENELGLLRARSATEGVQDDSLFRATPNVRSADGDPLFGPGTSRFTSVAPGADGTRGLAAFASRQGVRSTDLFDGPGGMASSPVSLDYAYGRRQQRDTWFGSVAWDPYPWLQLGLDVAHSRAVLKRGYNVFSQDLTLAAASPFNPFGRDVVVSLNETPQALGPDYSEARLQMTSAVFGALLKLPADWRVALDAQSSRSLTRYRGFAGVDAGRWQQLVDDGKYNPLRDTQVHAAPAAFYDEVLIYQGSRGQFVTFSDYDTLDAALRVTNQSLNLPTGRGALNIGGDYRRIHLAPFTDVRRYGNGDLVDTPQDWTGRTLQRYSAFGELQAPLLPSGRLPRWLTGLDADLAVREVASGKSGEAYLAPTLALKAEFADGLAFRSSLTTSNRFPTPQMSRPISLPGGPGGGSEGVLIFDPVLNDHYIVATSEPLNPPLKTESAVTQTAGLIFQRGKVHRLRAALDFVDTRKTDELLGLDAQSAVNLEALFPGQVRRDATTGRITSVLIGSVNAARRRSQNWNLSLDYAWSQCLGGTLELYGRWVYFQRYDRQVLVTSPVVDELGDPDGTAPGLLRHRLNFGAGWTGRGGGFGLDGHYFGQRILPEREWPGQGSDHIKDALQFDAYLQADLQRWLPWQGKRHSLRGQLRVNNVFGAAFPKYVNDPSGAGVQPYGDWRGRTYSLSLTATF